MSPFDNLFKVTFSKELQEMYEKIKSDPDIIFPIFADKAKTEDSPELQDAKKTITILKAKILELSNIIHTMNLLKKQHEELKVKYSEDTLFFHNVNSELREEIKNSESEYEKLKSEYEILLDRFKKEDAFFNKTRVEMSDELSKSKSGKYELMSQIKELESQNRILESKAFLFDEINNELRRRISVLEDDSLSDNYLSNKSQMNTAERDELLKTISALRKELQETRIDTVAESLKEKCKCKLPKVENAHVCRVCGIHFSGDIHPESDVMLKTLGSEEVKRCPLSNTNINLSREEQNKLVISFFFNGD